jgi:hypothetical protein
MQKVITTVENTMKLCYISTLLLFLPTTITCFSAVPSLPMGQMSSATLGTDSSAQNVVDVGSWRIVLNIGREAFSAMPFGWSASGCRLPLVIKADFRQDGKVIPREDTVRFTGPGGQVVSPIRQGSWSTSKDRNLEFSFSFPERMERRDVVLDAGSEIVCEGIVYAKNVVNELNNRFYEAREETWKVGKELNDIARRKESAKKWDAEKNQWVKRYDDEPIWSQIGKRINLLKAQAESNKKKAERPDPRSLSLESGPFPGFDNDVFLQKEGVVKIKGKGIIGRWSAEPINNRPVSYYNS